MTWELGSCNDTYLQIAELDHLSCKRRVEQLGGGAVLEQPVIEGRVGGNFGVIVHLHLPDQDDLSLLKAVHCSKSIFSAVLEQPVKGGGGGRGGQVWCRFASLAAKPG